MSPTSGPGATNAARRHGTTGLDELPGLQLPEITAATRAEHLVLALAFVDALLVGDPNAAGVLRGPHEPSLLVGMLGALAATLAEAHPDARARFHGLRDRVLGDAPPDPYPPAAAAA